MAKRMAVYLLALFMAIALTVVLAQDVDVRTGGDKVSADGSQSGRTVYSQRHLSPHRMMHFGKKAEQRRPASFLEPADYLASAVPAFQFRRLARRQTQAPLFSAPPGGLSVENNQLLSEGRPLFAHELSQYAQTQPVSLHLVTSDGQELTSIPEGLYIRGLHLPVGQFSFLDTSGIIQDKDAEILEGRRKAQDFTNDPAAYGGPTSMRLSSKLEEKTDSGGEKVNEQQEEQQAGAAINVNTRSREANSPRVDLPSKFWDQLLGPTRGYSSIPYSYFNKKAEPKDNLFMHFGRK